MTRTPTAAHHRTNPPRLVAVLATGVVAAGLLAGCGSSGVQDSAAGSRADVAPQAVEAEAAADSDGGAGSGAGSAVEPAQQMVTTGTVEVVVADPVAAAQEISTLVEQAGGRTEERTEQVRTETSEPRADLTVRVPADKVTPTLTALAEIGTVESTRISSTDVGGQARDLDARIKALETSAARLQTLMTTAATTADLLDAESTLTARQGDLESLQSQRNALADQVDLSTLDISLTTEPTAPEDEESPGFWGGLVTGWEALVSTVTVVVVVVGVALPWLVVAALVALVARWTTRRLRARRTVAPAAPDLQTRTDERTPATTDA